MNALLLAAALTASSVPHAVAAAGPIPPIAAPASPDSAAAALRNALTAIESTAGANPAAAQNARFFYDAGVEQERARDYGRARASALAALRALTVAPAVPAAAQPSALARPPFPGARYYVIPAELPPTPANARRYVALAQRALTGCAAPQARADYRSALHALGTNAYRAAMAQARDVVDDCAAR